MSSLERNTGPNNQDPDNPLPSRLVNLDEIDQKAFQVTVSLVKSAVSRIPQLLPRLLSEGGFNPAQQKDFLEIVNRSLSECKENQLSLRTLVRLNKFNAVIDRCVIETICGRAVVLHDQIGADINKTSPDARNEILRTLDVALASLRCAAELPSMLNTLEDQAIDGSAIAEEAELPEEEDLPLEVDSSFAQSFSDALRVAVAGIEEVYDFVPGQYDASTVEVFDHETPSFEEFELPENFDVELGISGSEEKEEGGEFEEGEALQLLLQQAIDQMASLRIPLALSSDILNSENDTLECAFAQAARCFRTLGQQIDLSVGRVGSFKKIGKVVEPIDNFLVYRALFFDDPSFLDLEGR